jgi:hypothetical protein
MIDAAFPAYRHLECEQSYYTQLAAGDPVVADFLRSFIAAWKMNKALALNGQQYAPDDAVLKQVVTLWNLAHSNSTTASIARRGPPNGYMPSPGIGGDAERNCADVLGYGPYVGYLVDLIGGSLVVNTGPLKKPPQTMTLTNNVAGGATGLLASRNAKVATFVIGSALIASSAYAYATGSSFVSVWKRILEKTKRTVRL